MQTTHQHFSGAQFAGAQFAAPTFSRDPICRKKITRGQIRRTRGPICQRRGLICRGPICLKKSQGAWFAENLPRKDVQSLSRYCSLERKMERKIPFADLNNLKTQHYIFYSVDLYKCFVTNLDKCRGRGLPNYWDKSKRQTLGSLTWCLESKDFKW